MSTGVLTNSANLLKTVRPWLFGSARNAPETSLLKNFGQYASRSAVKYGSLGTALYAGAQYALNWAKENSLLLAGVAAGAIATYYIAKNALSSIGSAIKWGVGIAATVGLAYFANQYFGGDNQLAAIVPAITPSAIANPKFNSLKDTIKNAFSGRGTSAEKPGERIAHIDNEKSAALNADVSKSAQTRNAVERIKNAEAVEGDRVAIANDAKSNTTKRSAINEIKNAEQATVKTSVPSVPRLENPESVAALPTKTSVPSVPLKELSKSEKILSKIKNIPGAAKARIAGNVPGIGPAFGVGAAGLTTYAHSLQRDFAESLHEEGVLSKEAYDAYNTLNVSAQAGFTGDIALSTADPTGLSILSTLGMEGAAQKTYKDWADKYAPNLNDESLQGLNMSWFSADNAQTEMMKKLAGHIPTDMTGQDPALHGVIAARKNFMDLIKENTINPYAKMIRDPEKREAALSANKSFYKKTIETQQIFKDEMSKLVSDPQNMKKYLNLVPLDEKLSHIQRLAKSDKGTTLLNSHPEVKSYIDKYSKSWTGWFIEKPPAASVDNYITSINGLQNQIGQTPKAPTVPVTPPAPAPAQ